MPGDVGDTPDMTASEPGPWTRRGFLTGMLAFGGAVAGDGATSVGAAADRPSSGAAVSPRLFSFVGGPAGGWSILSAKAVAGEALPAAERVEITLGAVPPTPGGAAWALRGVTSNERYVTRPEKEALVKKQAALGRPTADRAALIPIRKSAKWWALTQDERRAIFEERSRHITIGLKYLPAVARRLHHCRDLGESEPFDFITLFDFARADTNAFDDMLAALRASEEWTFVEREVDIRLERRG